ncbi:MAG: serine hydrolase domain-containing protein [Myxococcota bacterium]
MERPLYRLRLALPFGLGFACLFASTAVAAVETLGVDTVVVGTTPEQVIAAPLDRVDNVVRQQVSERQLVGTAIGVIKGEEITYLKGYGYEDLEAETPLLAQRSMIRWASISKPITAVIAARLVRDGVIDLDVPIQTYFKRYRAPRTHVLKCKKRRDEVKHKGKMLPCEDGYADVKVPKSQRVVTLRSLLAHTSGVRGYGGGRKGATPSRKYLNNPRTNKGLSWGLKKVLRSPFAYMPGTEYSYSTFGFNLAAVVMEHATGKDFPTLIAEHVSAPAGLETLQPDYAWVEIPNRSAGYRLPKRKKDVVRAKTYDVSWKMAGGGLISTPQDLARFCQGLMGDTLLTADEKTLLWTEQTKTDGEGTDYGLGFSVGDRDGRAYVEHAGVQPKTRSHLRLYPEENLCIVVMTNTTTAKTTALIDGIDDALKLD